MKKFKLLFYSFILTIILSISGCSNNQDTYNYSEIEVEDDNADEINKTNENTDSTNDEDSNSVTDNEDTSGQSGIDLTSIPEFSDSPYVVINNNIPYFTDDEITTEVFETYSELDELGRCGVAYANICQELMPTESRESISSVKPSGWHTYEYNFVDGGYLYNRCHLIGFQLAGENANELNLITGTRYMNVDGMLPFENLVDDYVDETDNHVLYRVAPIFDGNNLVANGVLMEALSVEDDGDGVCFCVYVYNNQPGVTIDYATGESWLSTEDVYATESDSVGDDSSSEEETTYILNTNSMKFHLPDCSGVESMSEKNKQAYTGTRSELIEQGYDPCGICNP